jgi:hypothetical protein
LWKVTDSGKFIPAIAYNEYDKNLQTILKGISNRNGYLTDKNIQAEDMIDQDLSWCSLRDLIGVLPKHYHDRKECMDCKYRVFYLNARDPKPWEESLAKLIREVKELAYDFFHIYDFYSEEEKEEMISYQLDNIRIVFCLVK